MAHQPARNADARRAGESAGQCSPESRSSGEFAPSPAAGRAWRREAPFLGGRGAELVDTARLGDDCLAVRYFDDGGDDRLVLVNFGVDLHLKPVAEPLLAPPQERRWEMLWHSNAPRY